MYKDIFVDEKKCLGLGVYDCDRVLLHWKTNYKMSGKNIKINIPYYKKKKVSHMIFRNEFYFIMLVAFKE